MGGGGSAERRAILGGSLRMTLENNRNVMLDRLRGHPRRESGEAGWHVLLLPGFQRLHEGFAEAGEFPAPEGRVVTVPGKEFGFEGHLRLSYCGTMKDITEGLERIQWALDPNSRQRTVPWRPEAGEGWLYESY